MAQTEQASNRRSISPLTRWVLAFAAVAGSVAGVLALLSGFCADDFVQLWFARAPYLTSVWSAISGPDMFSQAYYRPLARLVQHTTFALFGAHPVWHHGFSLLIHLINALLAFRLFRRLEAPQEVALVAAAVFAIHPAQVETVTFISAFSGLGAGACVLLALTAYIDYLKSSNRELAVTAIVFATLGLLFKEDVITIPLLMAVVWWFYSAHRKRQWWPIAVMVLIIPCWLGGRVLLGGIIAPETSGASLNPLLVTRNVLFHLARFVIPVRTIMRLFDFDLYFKLRDALPPLPNTPLYVAGVLVLAAAAIYAGYRGWRTLPRYAKAGLLVGLVATALYDILPESATRFLYVPIAGWALALVGWLYTQRTRLKSALIAVWVVLLGVAVVEQAAAWYGAGKRCETVLEEATIVRMEYPEKIGTVFQGFPARNYAAFVFPIGLEFAVDWRTQKHWPNLYVPYDLPSDRATKPDSILWFQWADDRFEPAQPPASE